LGAPSGAPFLAPPKDWLCDSVPQTILERVAAGDSAAVEECLQRYGGLVWSLARKLCPNHADAEDAVQEVLIEVWRHANRFDPQIASEATYITMIARRRLIDQFRKRGREPDTTSIHEETVESASRHERQTEIEEEAARARRYLEQLRPEQQQILELSITRGLSQSQIAEATNLPLGTVKTHARRGLIRLRELLGADQAKSHKGDTA
jgi:RNA polymerase sigma factor (sigma-70 family)